VTAVQPERVLQFVEAFVSGFIAAVGQPPPSLKQHGRGS
jgi:hypothetical protein